MRKDAILFLYDHRSQVHSCSYTLDVLFPYISLSIALRQLLVRAVRTVWLLLNDDTTAIIVDRAGGARIEICEY